MKRLRGQVGLWIVIIALIIVKHSSCLATTIVAIRTPEVFAIAADSEGTFKGGKNPPPQRPVSKIFQEGGVLYAISGLAQDARRGFDPAEMIAVFAQKFPFFPNMLTNLEAALSKSLEEELARLRTEEPLLFQDSIEDDNAGTEVLLGWFENGEPVAVAIGFFGAVDPDGQLGIKTTRFACPGDCPGETYTFFLGHRKAIDQYLTEHGKDFAMSPEECVRFLVNIEIDARTPGVGPPVDAARLNKNGIEWLSGGPR